MKSITVDDVWDLEAEDGWLVDARGRFSSLASTLTDQATTVSTTREGLAEHWEGASGACSSASRSGGSVTFSWSDDEDQPGEIATEQGRARTIVGDLRETLGTRASSLDSIGQGARAIADAWAGPGRAGRGHTGLGPSRGPVLRADADHGDTTTVTTGKGDDTITVTVDPDTGETVLTVTYYTDTQCVVEEVRIPAGQEVVINTGGGSDTISVPAGTDVDLRFSGGEGEDTVSAQEAEGDIEVFGGKGADTLELGSGSDTVHGGADDDYVDSGGGDDRVFGGLGNDILYGMGGEDVVSGGEGNDYLEGATGDDHDTMDGEQRITIEIPSEEHYTRWLEFEVDGSDAFQQRILADLQMMASSETGQTMLEAQGRHYDESGFLGMGKDKVVIREFDEQNGYVSHGAPGDYSITINPDYQGSINNSTDPNGWSGKPPVVVLFHEMGHINQFRSQGGGSEHWTDPATGERYVDENGQPLLERQNVGLDWDTSVVPEGDGDDYDFDLTENGFRDEIGIPRREWY
ncbi:M91 family zinc metallopeptidase [Serinicoccus marinus]|uniref:M91 family zinc metallopeptidase n=1 Tax=Serinicoccus marinus TaxID=247333 RepID=UPI002492D546|nr:M91 family zinc metallopeptidase [Serinicoccus marinus]